MATIPGADAGQAEAPAPPASEAPPAVDSKEKEFVHIAAGSAYVRVFVDGVEISKHAQQHKAVQAAQKQKRLNPAARVTYRPEYEIEVTEAALE